MTLLSLVLILGGTVLFNLYMHRFLQEGHTPYTKMQKDSNTVLFFIAFAMGFLGLQPAGALFILIMYYSICFVDDKEARILLSGFLIGSVVTPVYFRSIPVGLFLYLYTGLRYRHHRTPVFIALGFELILLGFSTAFGPYDSLYLFIIALILNTVFALHAGRRAFLFYLPYVLTALIFSLGMLIVRMSAPNTPIILLRLINRTGALIIFLVTRRFFPDPAFYVEKRDLSILSNRMMRLKKIFLGSVSRTERPLFLESLWSSNTAPISEEQLSQRLLLKSLLRDITALRRLRTKNVPMETIEPVTKSISALFDAIIAQSSADEFYLKDIYTAAYTCEKRRESLRKELITEHFAGRYSFRQITLLEQTLEILEQIYKNLLRIADECADSDLS